MNRISDIPQFDRHQHRGERFSEWKTKMTAYVGLLTAGMNRSQSDLAMLSAIRLASSDRTFQQIVGLSTTFETAMIRLEATFGLSQAQKELLFWEKYTKFSPYPNETLKEVAMRLMSLLHQAQELNILLSPSQFRQTVTSLVPFSVRDFVSSRLADLTELAGATNFLNELVTRYGDYVYRGKWKGPEKLNKFPKAQKRNYDAYQSNTSHNDKTNIKKDQVKTERRVTLCYSCGQPGHIASKCPNKNQVNNTMPSNVDTYDFLVDTGSFTHVFGRDLIPYCEILPDDKVDVSVPFGEHASARKARLLVSPLGSSLRVSLEGIIDEKRSTNLLKPDSVAWTQRKGGVAYVQGVPFLVRTGTDFPMCKMLIIKEISDKEVDETSALNCLQKVWFSEASTEEGITLEDMILVFHHQLLHPNTDRTRATLASLGVRVPRKLVEKALLPCEYCHIKEPVRNPVNYVGEADEDYNPEDDIINLSDSEISKSDFIETATHEDNNQEDNFPVVYKKNDKPISSLSLFADVGYISTKSEKNFVAFSVIKERSSGYLWVKPLTSTSEVKVHVRDVVNWLARKVPERPVVSFQSDNGTEYDNGELIEFLEQRGISVFRNPKRSKESNGTAERAVREVKKLINLACEVLAVRKTNWDWVTETAAYAYNLTCAFNRVQCPWFLLIGELPQYRLLPTRPIVVQEEESEGIISKNPVQGIFMCLHFTGAKVDYLVNQDSHWDWREEHPSFINHKKDLITRLRVEMAKGRPIIDFASPQAQPSSVPALPSVNNAAPMNDSSNVTQYSRSVERQKAMKKELDGFLLHDVFGPKYPNVPVVPTIWLHTIKSDGSAKARLVVLGNRWKTKGKTSTSPPTIEALSVFLAILACRSLPCLQVDISTAFLHADIDEPVNVLLPRELPDGFPYRGVVGLRKAVYGLAQSPLLFEKHLDNVFKGLNFTKVASGIYSKHECLIYAYVDDLLIQANNPENIVKEIARKVQVGRTATFNPGDQVKFLGANLTRTEHKIEISLKEYAQEFYSPGIRGAITNESMHCNEKTEPDWRLLEEIQSINGVLGWIARFYPKAAVYHSVLSSTAMRHPCRKILTAIRRCVNLYTAAGNERVIKGSEQVDLLLMSDASHSISTLSARAGVIIAIQSNEDHADVFPVLAKTKRVARKIKSAFEAELEAALLMTEIYKKYESILKLLPIKSIKYISDSQALVAAIKNGKTMDPFSTSRLELLAQRLTELHIPTEWQPRRYQYADVMTKI